MLTLHGGETYDMVAAPEGAMLAAELVEVTDVLCWGPAALARAAGIREATVQRMFNGSRYVPPGLAAHLRLLADFHRAHPFPEAPPYVPRETGDGGPETRG